MKRIHVTPGRTEEGLTPLEVEGEVRIGVSPHLVRLLEMNGPGHLLFVGDGEVVRELGTAPVPMQACVGELVECTAMLVEVLARRGDADPGALLLAQMQEKLATIRVLLSYLRQASDE